MTGSIPRIKIIAIITTTTIIIIIMMMMMMMPFWRADNRNRWKETVLKRPCLRSHASQRSVLWLCHHPSQRQAVETKS